MRLAVAGTVALIAAPLIVGAPAVADDDVAPSEAPFVAAQQNLGLSDVDAAQLHPGISVSADRRGAAVSLGDFEVTVASETDQQTSTTVLADGARVMSLLVEGQTSTNFRVDVPENVSLVPAAGGFDLVGDAAGTKVTLGRIHEPWAIDAEGKQLPTSYSLEGNVLIQRVDTTGAVFPVVADPAVTAGWGADGPGVYWNMYGYQMKTIQGVTASALGAALAGGCAGASKIPSVGGIISALCGFIGAPTLGSIWGAIQNILSNPNIDNFTCYQTKVVPIGSGPHPTGGGDCA
jgi:hypothetical protein